MSEPYHKQLSINESANPVSAVEGKSIDRLRGKTSLELLKELLAILRAQSWLYQTLHWQTKNYDRHLLFERLYNGIPEQVDTLAEKLVGYFGGEVVDKADSMSRATKWLRDWDGGEVKVAIESEKQFQSVVRTVYDQLKTKKELSLGLDDFLMNIANAHETHLYLLGQIDGNS